MENEIVVVTSKVSSSIKERLEKLAKADRRTLSNYIAIVLESHVEQADSESNQKEAA